MAETAESAATTQTKKIINPRVEIDTSPPFESVKEAVDRFGGSGPWIPHHLLRLSAAHHDTEVLDVEKMEEQAIQLERDLIMKEQETLNVLKELEAAKRLVQGLKVNLMPELLNVLKPVPSENSTESFSFCPPLSPGLMFVEMNQTRLNLNKTSVDLAAIKASVESLSEKLRRDKVLLERRTKIQIPNSYMSRREADLDQKVEQANGPDISFALLEPKQVNFEAEQFKKMTEASRYEVMKAMTEIERTKNSIKMAEMRLNAAKKMEEAAKAVEVIALFERQNHVIGENSSDGFLHKPDGVTLSFEEYHDLTRKAKQTEDLCKNKFIDTNEAHQLEVPILEKFEQTMNESKQSYAMKEEPNPGFRTKTSIGEVLSRKYILQDDVMMGRHVENHSDRQHVSLSQMLQEQNRNKPTEEGNVEKQYFVQRKKFGFIQVPIPTKQSKKKGQSLNLR